MATKITKDCQMEPPNYPYDWYTPFPASEVKAGKIKSFSFMGHELVAYRNKDNTISVMDATCPHFGAHLGKGCMRDGNIECPFHGLQFDKDGQAVASDYYQNPESLKKLKLTKWVHHVAMDQLWIWHGPEREPMRPLPNTMFGLDGWSSFATSKKRIVPNTNIQFFNENVIDVPHFDIIHKLNISKGKRPELDNDGYYSNHTHMTWQLSGQSPNKLIQKYGTNVTVPFDLHFKIFNPGAAMGYGHTKVGLFTVEYRVVACLYPEDESTVSARVAVCLRRPDDFDSRGFLQKAGVILKEKVITNFLAWMGRRDLNADVNVWNRRRFISNPKLLEEDGPLVEYRKWYLRFWHKDYIHLLAEPPKRMDLSDIPQMRGWVEPRDAPYWCDIPEENQAANTDHVAVVEIA